MLRLSSVLMKLPDPTNKLNECLRYQAVIAGRLFSLPNYWYFLLHQLDLQQAGREERGGRLVIIFHLLGQLLRQGCILWNVFHRLFIISRKSQREAEIGWEGERENFFEHREKRTETEEQRIEPQYSVSVSEATVCVWVCVCVCSVHVWGRKWGLGAKSLFLLLAS